MKAFQNKNEFELDEIETRDRTTSTLLIPSALLSEFEKKKNQSRNDLALYLRLLLRRYRVLTHSGLIPRPSKIKTEYQEKEQDLVRVGFRPMNIPPYAPAYQRLRMDRTRGACSSIWKISLLVVYLFV